MVRINKFLAQCNLGSRRQVEELITSGKIKVNGVICTELGTQINPAEDKVVMGRKELKIDTELIYVMLNKPKNYLVTTKDEFDRRTVYKLLPEFAIKLNPIGRLDKDSEGLLILTNDGNFAQLLIHPRNKLPKTYKVVIKGKLAHDDLLKLRAGVEIEGQKTLPAKIYIKKETEEESTIKITIYEGRNRQIRKMFEKFHHDVVSLKRIEIGSIELGKLPTGMWRFLTPQEILSVVGNYRQRTEK